MKFLKNKAQKALMAAVTMSLVLGMSGSAMAENWFGHSDNSWGDDSNPASSNFVGVWDGTKDPKLFNLYGALAKKGDASSNVVTFTGGTMICNLIGGASSNGSAIKNTVNINGGTFAKNYKIYGGLSGGVSASENTVNINGGAFATEDYTSVYGGFCGYGSASNNIVCIGVQINAPTLTVYGGYGKTSSNNTVKFLSKAKGSTIYELKSTQKLEFTVLDDVKDNDVILNVKSGVNLSDVVWVNTNISTEKYIPGTTISLLSSEYSVSGLSTDALYINGEKAVEKTITVDGLNKDIQAAMGYDVTKNAINFTTMYKLINDTNVAEDIKLGGRLDLNGKTLNMQQDEEATGDAVKYNTVEAKKLIGTGNLAIDVDLAKGQNDKIHITGSEENNATINLKSIIVRTELDGEDRTENDKVTVISSETPEGLNGITLNLKDLSVKTATTDCIYTFTQGSAGKLNVTKESSASIVDFIQGNKKYADIATYALNKDETAKGDLDTTKRTGDNKVLNLEFNENISLSGNNKFKGVTVADGYTLMMNGVDGAPGNVTGFKDAAVTNNGTLEVANIKFVSNDKDIVNNGALNLAGANAINDISGTGAMFVNAGTTEISKGLTQGQINIKNNGKLVVTGTTNIKGLNMDKEAAFEQKDGNFVLDGSFTNAADVTLSNLGGSDVDYKALETAKNKVTGKLTNNGAFTLKNTYLTVTDFEGADVNVVGDSLLYIINVKAPVELTAGSIINNLFKAEKVEEALTVKENPEDSGKRVAVASSFDKALVEIEAKGIDEFAKFVGNGKLIVPEGMLDGETTFDANGVHKKKGATNDVVDSLAEAVSFARVEMNDIRKRMGDVRQVKETKGIWARNENGKLEGAGMDSKFHKFQIGTDKAISEKWRVGGAVSYTNGNTHYNHGSNSNKTYSGAAYGMYTGSNGEFVDVIARVGVNKSKLNFNAGGVQQHGDLDRIAFALSAEAGKTFELNNNLYVEPQAELTYTRSGSDEFTSNGAKYNLKGSDSFIGRAGFTLGYKAPENRGGVYTRLSWLHEFAGDKTLVASNAGITKTYENAGSDTWLEWAVGGQINTSKATYIYADVEKTFNAKVNEKYRVNVGLRYSF